MSSHFSLPERPKEAKYVQEVEISRTFSNPICKETYDSLPKIYGKKKKKIRLIALA